VDQISGSTTPADAPAPASAPVDAGAPAQDQIPPAEAVKPAADQSPPAGAVAAPESPSFRSRASARRRARFLRRARELAYRDLGGLVFNLHRFGARNDALVLAKLTTLGHIDAELRALEDALQERRPITVLREAGITACPRCAAIHGSEDRFCPSCGLAIGRHVDLPADLRSGPGAPVAWSATAPSAQPPLAPAQPASAEPARVAPSAPAPQPVNPVAPGISQPPGTSPYPATGRAPTPPATLAGGLTRAGAEGARTKPSAAEEQTPGGENEPTEILRPHGGGA
jgi:hypothetical protein